MGSVSIVAISALRCLKVSETMAVFFDTGGGDIYGGPTTEAVIAAMLSDEPSLDLTKIEEVSGDTQMVETDENEEPTGDTISLEDEYDETLGSYIVASNN